MSMAETLTVLNKLVEDGVVATYAIAGAVAAYNYIEPTLTEDLDVLVTLDNVRSHYVGSDTLGTPLDGIYGIP